MYTSRPSSLDAKYYIACEVWACAGSKISFWGLKARSSLDFFFSLSLLPSFFAFLASYFFFCWVLSKLHYGGKFFWKAFRILGLDETRGSRGTRFSWKFSGQCYTCFAFFSGVLD